MNGYIIALDQGTTSSRSIIFDSKGNIVSLAQYPFTQIYPKPGWVEHDPMVILESQLLAMSEAFEKSGLSPTDIAGIGITNQRETTIVWDKHTGRPVYNAIVWQCRRTAPICDQLMADGLGDYVKEKTGLLIDAYFSGTKIKWILDNVPGARERAERGDLLFGNVDAWLIWNLTGGRAHVSDYSNCSRTMLFDIDRLCWDEKLCERLGIPMSMLPTPVPSSMVYGRVTAGLSGGARGRARLRQRRRPGGCAARSGVHRAGSGEEHLWYGLLHAHEHRQQVRAQRQRSGHECCVVR